MGTSHISSSFDENQHAGVCNFSHRVNTRSLGPYSHRVFTRKLRLYGLRVFTRTLCPRSPRVLTRPLWALNTLPTCRLIPSCACWSWALWGMIRPLMGFILCIWSFPSLLPGWRSLPVFWLSWDLWVYVYARCIKVASIRSTVAATTSTSRSMWVNHRPCSSPSTVECWLF